jgi:hypothetical protein
VAPVFWLRRFRRTRRRRALATVAAHRRVEPRKFGHLMRGELDWVVMRAMEKDRTRRYETWTGWRWT